MRDRVHYEDLARQPYTPPNPGLHHRNETIAGLSDPQLSLHVGREIGSWGVAGKAGISIPVGRTEANPFELGRLGKWHQHVQLGTGTWDPILEAGVGRTIGATSLRLSAIGRFTLDENDHGYQAGNRYALILDGMRRFTPAWSGDAGLALLREEAETWGGQIETEGNLGRTDLFLSLGVTRVGTAVGTLHAGVQIPLYSHAREHQTEIPIVARIGWSP